MGQYHIAVNLDRLEYIMPHRLGDGLKLREQLGSSTGIPQALHVLLCACPEYRGGGDYEHRHTIPEARVVGRWAGQRVAIVGDYAEDSDLPAEFMASTIYAECREDTDDRKGKYRDITDLVAPVLGNLLEVDYVGEGWLQTKARTGEDPPRRMTPDMVLTTKGKPPAEGEG